MDRTTLQTPKMGRSRFSKALPAPPRELENDVPRMAPQDPSSFLYSPFPPRQDSVSVNSVTSPDTKPNLSKSSLPALPSNNTMEGTRPQTRKNSIPRKPVGLPAKPTPTAAAAAVAKKMRRVSSISSLLSAYSNTSSDSVQRSSQGSIYTKDSEPSNSPEREGMNDVQKPAIKYLPEIPSNPYADMGMTDEMLAASLPSLPPLMDMARSKTPPNSRPQDQLSASGPDAQLGDQSASSPTLGGSSPQKREIWRRRASSKSDHSLLVSELKLADSHGSTASTTQPINSEFLPPPPTSAQAPSPSPAPQISNATSPLPPRNASLPGRNIRPIRQPEPQGEDEMRKLSSKLKELTSRDEGGRDEPVKMGEYSGRSRPRVPFGTETNPAPPKKEKPAAEKSSTNTPKSLTETTVETPLPSAPPAPPAPSVQLSGPPNQSAEKLNTRRPVGAPAPSQSEVHKKGSSSDMRKQNPGLPRFPRPSQSNSSLRSPSASYNAQEAMKTPVLPQLTLSTPTPYALPADSSEPIKKSDLFNIVTALNEPSISPDTSSSRKPTRKVSRDVDATALSDIGEATEHMTAEQVDRINEALSRFPRSADQTGSPADTVWQAPPLASRHYNCYVSHDKWVAVKNTHYPLACQTCGVKDTSTRKTCSWCNLRICTKCHERLTGPYKSDLRILMEKMEIDQYEDKRREKGKQTAAT